MGINPYAMQALYMQHRCGTRSSAPCCKSAGTIPSVPADLYGLKYLIHLPSQSSFPTWGCFRTGSEKNSLMCKEKVTGWKEVDKCRIT
jgi:hypothetical protein